MSRGRSPTSPGGGPFLAEKVGAVLDLRLGRHQHPHYHHDSKTLRDAFGLLFHRRFRFLKALRVDQDDQASEWQGKIEMTPELLGELQDKARQRGLSLFAYLAHFIGQDNKDNSRKGPRFE